MRYLIGCFLSVQVEAETQQEAEAAVKVAVRETADRIGQVTAVNVSATDPEELARLAKDMGL